MSKKYLVNIDLNGNEVQNAVVQNLASAPSSPTPGRIYYDTAVGSSKVWNGTSWAILDATKTSGVPVSAISGFQTTIQGYSLSSFAAPTASIAMAGYTFTGLPAPSAAGQAAEYSWVLGQIQSAAAGIVSKTAVRAVAVSNIASLSGTPSIDGYQTSAGDRVLLTAQTTAAQNGPWIVAAGAWARPATEGATGELDPGALWLVLNGTVNAGTQWRMSTTGTIVVGTTSISIVQFGAAASYTAGNGLTGTNTFAVQAVANGGIVVNSSGVAVDTTVVTRKYATTIGDGTSTTYTVTRNLNTQDVAIACRMVSTQQAAEVDWTATTVNTVTVVTAQPLAANSLRVLVLG